MESMCMKTGPSDEVAWPEQSPGTDGYDDTQASSYQDNVTHESVTQLDKFYVKNEILDLPIDVVELEPQSDLPEDVMKGELIVLPQVDLKHEEEDMKQEFNDLQNQIVSMKQDFINMRKHDFEPKDEKPAAKELWDTSNFGVSNVGENGMDDLSDGTDMKSSTLDGLETHTELQPVLVTDNTCYEVEFVKNPGQASGSGTADLGEKEIHEDDIPLAIRRVPRRPERPSNEEAPPTEPPKRRPHSCDSCGLSYKTLASLIIHTRSHTGDKPFACDMCEWRFDKLSDLKSHFRTHKGRFRGKRKYFRKKYTQLGTETVTK